MAGKLQMQHCEVSQSILTFIEIFNGQRKSEIYFIKYHSLSYSLTSLFIASLPFQEKWKHSFVVQLLQFCKNLTKQHACKIKLQNATFTALLKMVMSERIIVIVQSTLNHYNESGNHNTNDKMHQLWFQGLTICCVFSNV